METYGLKSAQEMREYTSASRELILKDELAKFFDMAQRQIIEACNRGRNYVNFKIDDNSCFTVLNVETSTTMKQVFETQGYTVKTYRSTYPGEDNYVEIESNW